MPSPMAVASVGNEVLAGIGLSNLRSVGSEKVANTSGLRREWRINANTGDLRGVYYLHRGKDRKPAYYIGKREKPDEFNKIYPAFEAWRRAD